MNSHGRPVPNQTVKYILTLGCWILDHSLCLRCHDTLKEKNDAPVTVVEGLNYDYNIGATVGGKGI